MRLLPIVIILALGMVIALSVSSPALAADEYTLTLRNNEFSPKELKVPSGKKFTLIVKNENTAAAEFESDDFRREKIIPAGNTARINVGALKAGTYTFFDEFHESTKGTLIVE